MVPNPLNPELLGEDKIESSLRNIEFSNYLLEFFFSKFQKKAWLAVKCLSFQLWWISSWFQGYPLEVVGVIWTLPSPLWCFHRSGQTPLCPQLLLRLCLQLQPCSRSPPPLPNMGQRSPAPWKQQQIALRGARPKSPQRKTRAKSMTVTKNFYTPPTEMKPI